LRPFEDGQGLAGITRSALKIYNMGTVHTCTHAEPLSSRDPAIVGYTAHSEGLGSHKTGSERGRDMSAGATRHSTKIDERCAENWEFDLAFRQEWAFCFLEIHPNAILTAPKSIPAPATPFVQQYAPADHTRSPEQRPHPSAEQIIIRHRRVGSSAALWLAVRSSDHRFRRK
jgi:hypothetical protein